MSRPRKTNVRRDASGKSRGEYEGIHPETIAVRERELRKDGIVLQFKRFDGVKEVNKSTATDAKAGFTLGRLLLFYEQGDRERGISPNQYNAGDYWSGLCRRHAQIMGYSLGPRSFDIGAINGLSTQEPLQEIVDYVRAQWKGCFEALQGLGCSHGLRPLKLAFGVCVENWPVGSLNETDFGCLRIALNTLEKAIDRSKIR